MQLPQVSGKQIDRIFVVLCPQKWRNADDEIPVPIDINKIVRMDYGDDLIYQNLACEALPIWRQWNEEVKAEGKPLVYNETGLLLLSRNGKFPDYERLSMQNIRAAGYGHAIEELPTPESIVERFPQFSSAVANGFDIAYLNKYAGESYCCASICFGEERNARVTPLLNGENTDRTAFGH